MLHGLEVVETSDLFTFREKNVATFYCFTIQLQTARALLLVTTKERR